MGENEHLEIARRLAELADRLYQDGDDIAEAEMLWGTVNRIISAIAVQHQLSGDTTPPRRGVVLHHIVSRHIVGQQSARGIRYGLGAASALHGHFYNSHLDAAGVSERVAGTKSFIAALLNLYHQHARQ